MFDEQKVILNNEYEQGFHFDQFNKMSSTVSSPLNWIAQWCEMWMHEAITYLHWTSVNKIVAAKKGQEIVSLVLASCYNGSLTTILH